MEQKKQWAKQDFKEAGSRTKRKTQMGEGDKEQVEQQLQEHRFDHEIFL